jgi:hypothetical protein
VGRHVSDLGLGTVCFAARSEAANGASNRNE